MTYRIYTEHVCNEFTDTVINKIVPAYFGSFNVIKDTGSYNGTRENSLIIEIFTLPIEDDNKVRTLVHSLAEDIKYYLKQDSVLITEALESSVLI